MHSSLPAIISPHRLQLGPRHRQRILPGMRARTAVIRQIMEWAAAHLDADLSVDALARRAGYSLHHFSRAFLAETGESPAGWVRAQRLSHAAQRLRDKRHRVLDIALECGFGDVTTFTRAFRRRTGMSPSTFRRAHSGADSLPPGGIIVGPHATIEGFRLCGLSADMSNDPTAPARLWQRLFSALGDTVDGMECADFRQVAFWRGAPETLYTCIAGFVVDGRPALPLPFVTIDIPAATCRRFIVDGRSDCYAAAYDTVFEALLPAMRDRPAGNFVCERARLDGGDGIEIWVPVEAKPLRRA